LLAQRIYALVLGHEDLNDHEQLRRDPVLAAACDKPDPLFRDRVNPDDRGMPLAAPSTLNRLELSNHKQTRGHKLPHDLAKVAACRLEIDVRCLQNHAKEVVIDLDRMGHLVHGLQEGRHPIDYNGDYCYLPSYRVMGDVLLRAQLRTRDKGGADGRVPALGGSSRRSAGAALGPGSSCGATVVFAWRKSWPDARRRRRFTTAAGWRRTRCCSEN